MKAMYLNRKGGADALNFGEIPRPVPKEGEVLVKVRATAAMPTELQWEPTFNTPTGQPRQFPIVLSHEFSGVVESAITPPNGFTPGAEVYGLNDWYINGAQAEYCVVAADGLAPKPTSLSYAESAIVPISALTAWQALFEKGQLERGQRVLIHGASGGVGQFAVQLARWRGARVIATASVAHLDFVRALGADQLIDYHKTRFEDVICDVDVVLDPVGGDMLKRSWGVLKPNGKLVTVATSSGADKDERVSKAFMIVRADGKQLGQIGRMIEAGELRVFPGGILPLTEAREAYKGNGGSKVRGKVALQVAE